jgi:hypothetical protein
MAFPGSVIIVLRHGEPLTIPEFDYLRDIISRTCTSQEGDRAYIYPCSCPPDTEYAMGAVFETIRLGGINEFSTTEEFQSRDISYWRVKETDGSTVMVLRASVPESGQ